MSVSDVVHRFHDRVLGSFGRAPGERAAVVRAMLQPRNGDATGYWLQLVIATTLATLGLALDSTAVVIGAMLIAPLMTPLVELAMGLATGSAGLVLRAAVRTVMSIAVAIGVAFAIVWILPFHQITAELESRTAPSLLDLVVAGACALAAGYASLRADADIATTAAGTSIGISLVPPLCAVGYGLAIGDTSVSRGAGLLFIANLSGILVIATLLFALAGFARVDIRAEEQALDDLGSRMGRSIRVGRAWSRLVGRRIGPFARIVPPLVLLGIVFVPLHRALDEIARRNAIRTNVAKLLEPGERGVVQYALDQKGKAVELRVVVVGDARTASDLETTLRARLQELGVAKPVLSIWAVPDAAAVSSLSKRVDALPPAVKQLPVPETAHRHSAGVAEALRAAWPRSGTGELVGLWHDLDRPKRVRVIHLGSPLGSAGIELLARALRGLDELELEEDALLPVEASAAEGLRWLPQAVDLVARARRLPGVQLCVWVPEGAKPPERPQRAAALNDARWVRSVIESTLGSGGGQVAIADDTWRISPQRGPCESALQQPAHPAIAQPAPR